MTDQEQYSNYPQQGVEEGVRLRDMEERQRLLRDRILLVGKNLIETRGETEKELGKIKRDLETIKQDIVKIKSLLSTISEELGNTAKRSELMILEKQFKMFEPLEFARIKDVEEMLKRKNK